jgi:hypothetical protein
VVIVMPMDPDPDLRAEIDAVSREHDRLMARDREPIGTGYVRKKEPAGLRYRDAPNSARALAAAEPPIEGEIYTDETTGLVYRLHDRDAENERNSADWNAWVRSHLEAEREFLLKAMAGGMSEYVHFHLTERDRKIASLEAELAECKGMLGRALTALDDAHKVAAANDAEQRETIDELKRRDLERHVRDRTIAERSARISELQRENSASHAELARQQRDQELAQRDARINLIEIKLAMLLNFLGQSIDLPRGFGRTDDA